MSNLPDIEFAERDATVIEASVITMYESISGRTLATGDPVRLFLEAVAALIIQQRSIIDFTGKQNLSEYASGDYLEHLGDLVQVTRLPAQSAITTIRYTLSAAQASAYTVPAGTEVTGGGLIFDTTDPLEIPAGNLTGDVQARCQVAGVVGNGLLSGQIKTQVNPLPFVASITNTGTTQGGAEIESDDSLRERIRLAPSQFSVAGPATAYTFFARSANQSITDVSVIGPPDVSPGEVHVYPLLEDGEIPGAAVLAAVDAVLQDDNVRPLTDEVTVLAPSAANYDVTVSYWIDRANLATSVSIQAAVSAAVQDYTAWQRAKIGRDITPDELTKRMMTAGAKRVVITDPVFAVLGATQVAQDGTILVTYAGVEEG